MRNETQILKSYDEAKKIYKDLGVDTEKAIEIFRTIPISLHNWQMDDVIGFENNAGVASENLVTGSYPGRARNGDEMRNDIDTAFSLSPCRPKVNLHSMYGEPGTTERKDVSTADFEKWIEWAEQKGYGMDFNVSFFTHPKMLDGCSLASDDRQTREYWIQAGINGRRIANEMGRRLGQVCINNVWIPDGMKDTPVNRFRYREYLEEALDRIFEEKFDKNNMRDVCEGKLFGIGKEAFTVGSHEFYLAYAVKNGIGVCMDTGHYHPTETVADKISAVYKFVDTVMLHISRGIRWDSDHVLIQNDDLSEIMRQVVRGGLYAGGRLFIGLDYFDATVNRVAAQVIGLRAAGKALLEALLEPFDMLNKAEIEGNYTERLAISEEVRNLPANVVWDYLCLKTGVPVGMDWLEKLKRYEAEVMFKRK